MLIQCTSCGTQAKIPDSKEGAKVRCAECGQVYVARRPGAKAAKKQDPTKYVLIGGGVLAAIAAVMIATSGDDPPPPPPKVEAPVAAAEAPLVDDTGWDSPAVKLTRELHTAALAGNKAKLLEAIEPEAAYVDWRDRQVMAHAQEVADIQEANAAAGEGVPMIPEPPALDIPEWDAVDLSARNLFVDGLVDAGLEKNEDNLLTAWRPFVGSVTSLSDKNAVVRLQLARAENDDGTNRWIEWRLVNRGGLGSEARWRVAGWNQYFTPEELASMRRGRKQKTTRRTLSDGSVVIESEIRRLDYPAAIPQAQRDRVEELTKQLIDLNLRPRQRTAAQEALLAEGKAAIIPLLNVIADIVPKLPDAGEDRRHELMSQIGLADRVLQDFTGHVTSFKPDVSLGATQERIESGLKQWFGWYDRKFLKFDGKPVVGEDPLLDDPDFQPRNARERREFEAAKRKAEQGG